MILFIYNISLRDMNKLVVFLAHRVNDLYTFKSSLLIICVVMFSAIHLKVDKSVIDMGRITAADLHR